LVGLGGGGGAADAVQMTVTSAPKARLLTLRHLDGRTAAVRKVRGILRTLQAELGHKPSNVQRAAMERAAAMMAIAEDARARILAGDPSVSMTDVTRADNCARRAMRDLVAVGRKRRKPKPDLAFERLLAERRASRAKL
jgi:hypothetical protein